jgi:hypothetical protein
MQDYSGAGIFVAMRADATNGQSFFRTTQGKINLNQNGDFARYSVRLHYFQGHVQALYIFFVLNGKDSKGTAYIDDVTLLSYQ